MGEAVGDADGAAYDERLRVPVRWWVLAALFLGSLLLAFLVATPWWLAIGATLVLTALLVTVFVSYGAARVLVREGVLTAGRARIAVTHLGRPVALDPTETRRVAGVAADARAYLLLRPYLKRSVRVPIQDPADATPYWLVSSRHPDRLVAALDGAAARQWQT
ncbi:MAG: DUF3093 domain-containing protein [Nocardioidaceae bacterium]